MNISIPIGRFDQSITVLSFTLLFTMISSAGGFVYSTLQMINKYKYVSACGHAQAVKNINKLKHFNKKIQEEKDKEAKGRIMNEKNLFYSSIVPMDVSEVEQLNDEIDLRLYMIKIFECPFYAFCIMLAVVFSRGALAWANNDELYKDRVGLRRKSASNLKIDQHSP